MKYFTVTGLVLDIIGAAVLSWGLFITKKEAIELGLSRVCGDSDEENLKLPQVADRLKQSRNAKYGLFLLVLGFVSQIIGVLCNR